MHRFSVEIVKTLHNYNLTHFHVHLLVRMLLSTHSILTHITHTPSPSLLPQFSEVKWVIKASLRNIYLSMSRHDDGTSKTTESKNNFRKNNTHFCLLLQHSEEIISNTITVIKPPSHSLMLKSATLHQVAIRHWSGVSTPR